MLRKFGTAAFVAALLGSTMGACGSDTLSEDDECVPGAEQDCTCDSGEDGEMICDSDGRGYGECDCDTTPGSGGSGGGDIGTGGGGGTGGGTGGTGGGSGGTLSDSGLDSSTDAGSDATVDAGADAAADGSANPTPDAGSDASAPDASEPAPDASPDTGVPDSGSDDPCTTCLVGECTDELVACDEPDPCTATDDAGVSDSECMFFCLDEETGPGIAEVDACADVCGPGGENVSAATRALFHCMFGNGDAGAGCRAECGY